MNVLPILVLLPTMSCMLRFERLDATPSSAQFSLKLMLLENIGIDLALSSDLLSL